VSALADRIVAEARSWIGTPYRHQASVKGVGADCLGLVRGVWRALYGAEPEPAPPYSPGWAEEGGEALALAAARHMTALAPERAEAGDLLLFRWRDGLPARHCGILVGAGRMVHAQSGAVVAEVPVSPWWRRRAAYAFRFPDLGD